MKAPPWLETFQQNFSTVSRRSILQERGVLASTPGLAVYNRQYWFRIFNFMHGEYVLTAKLLGYSAFNVLVERFIIEHPPQHFDMQYLSFGFADFAHHTAQQTPLPVDALRQALQIDSQLQKVFLAPACTSWRLTPEAAQHPFAIRLQPSPASSLIAEDWPLLMLRESLLHDSSEQRVGLPPRLPAPQYWAVYRDEKGLCFLQLLPLQHRVYQLLTEQSLGAALLFLQQSLTSADLDLLGINIQNWLHLSAQFGFWIGSEGEPH